jgi:hypothetical protein
MEKNKLTCRDCSPLVECDMFDNGNNPLNCKYYNPSLQPAKENGGKVLCTGNAEKIGIKSVERHPDFSQEVVRDYTQELRNVRNEFAELIIQYDKYDKFDIMNAREQLLRFDEIISRTLESGDKGVKK